MSQKVAKLSQKFASFVFFKGYSGTLCPDCSGPTYKCMIESEDPMREPWKKRLFLICPNPELF